MRLGIALRFGSALVGISLASAVAVGFSVTAYFNEVIRQAETSDLASKYALLTSELAAASERATAMASLVAALPGVAESVERGDRAALAEQMRPVFEKLAKPYGIRQFQFHLPPATSFLRVHAPKKFGDDLSKFRETVVRTNSEKRASTGLEKGVAGLGVRGVVPLSVGDRHVGSVEFGLSFGKSFFQDFKAAHGTDAALLIPDGDKGGFKTFGGTRDKPLLTPQEFSQALAGTPVVRSEVIGGIRTAIMGARHRRLLG